MDRPISTADHGRPRLDGPARWLVVGGALAAVALALACAAPRERPPQALQAVAAVAASTHAIRAQVQVRGPAAVAMDDLVRATWATQGCGEALDLPGVRAGRAGVDASHAGGLACEAAVAAHPRGGGALVRSLLVNA